MVIKIATAAMPALFARAAESPAAAPAPIRPAVVPTETAASPAALPAAPAVKSVKHKKSPLQKYVKG